MTIPACARRSILVPRMEENRLVYRRYHAGSPPLAAVRTLSRSVAGLATATVVETSGCGGGLCSCLHDHTGFRAACGVLPLLRPWCCSLGRRPSRFLARSHPLVPKETGDWHLASSRTLQGWERGANLMVYLLYDRYGWRFLLIPGITGGILLLPLPGSIRAGGRRITQWGSPCGEPVRRLEQRRCQAPHRRLPKQSRRPHILDLPPSHGLGCADTT